MSKAILFFTESHLHDPEAQRKEVYLWLQNNSLNVKATLVEQVDCLAPVIQNLREDESLRFFVCNDVSSMGKCPRTIIKNFLRLEEAGIKVVVTNSNGLNNVDEHCPIAKATCPHAREAIKSVFAAIDQFEKKKRSTHTKRGMEKTKIKTGKHMGRPTKINDENKCLCERLKNEGKTLKEIADETGLSINTIRENLKNGC